VISKPFNPMTLAAMIRGYVEPANDRLDMLRSYFLQRVNDDAVTLAVHRSALNDKTGSPATLAGIRDIAHGLAGAGGAFGFSEMSDAAATLEKAVIVGSDSVEGIVCALDRLLVYVQTNCARRMAPPHAELNA
jgi:HPt (histidine-containing phosphotransfer) domain-containing protein